MIKFKSTFSFLTWLLITLSCSVCWSHTVTVDVSYWDSRSHRSSNTGSQVTGTAGNSPAFNINITLLDMDGTCVDYDGNCSESDDDILDFSEITDSDGEAVFTSISSLEDVYAITSYIAPDVRVYDDSGSSVIVFSQVKENIIADTTIKFSITCTGNTFGVCFNSTEVGNYPTEEAHAVILMTMNNGLDQMSSSIYQKNSHSNAFEVYYPDFPDGGCDGILAGLSVGYNEFCVANGFGLDNTVILHELGHNIHRRALNYDGTLNGGSNTQKTGVSEGWATFIAAALSWSSTSTDPFIGALDLEGTTNLGNVGYQECADLALSQPDPEKSAANVSRWFWDLYDTDNTDSCTHPKCSSGSDNASNSLSDIVDIWDDFTSGTGDRDNNESGNDGRNAWDFEHYMSSSHSELVLNCLSDQDP